MNNFEQKIYKIIAESNGIKGSEIAKKLDVDKKEVNSLFAYVPVDNLSPQVCRNN